MKNLLESLVGKVLNIPNDKIADYLYESDGTTIKADALEKLIAVDTARINGIKEQHKVELTAKYDDGYSKGKGESLSKFEKQLKEDYKITTDTKGTDLIKEIVAKNAKVELDEDKIKLSPLYIELERKLANDYVAKKDYETVKGEFDTYKLGVEKQKVVSVVKTDAQKVFRSLNPVLSKDAARATNQENDFLDKLVSFDFEVQTDGNHIIKTADGKRMETANGHAVNFNDFVKEQAAKYFDFAQQGDRNNAGNDPITGKAAITVPRNEAEYKTALANETDPKKAAQIVEAYKAANK